MSIFRRIYTSRITPWILAAITVLEVVGISLYSLHVTGSLFNFAPDSDSYVERHLSFRTPLYWLLFELGNFLGVEMLAALIFQLALWCVAVIYLWTVSRQLAGWWGAAVTTFFAVYPQLMVWLQVFLPEAIGIALVVIAICLTYDILHKHRLRSRTIWLTIVLAALLLTRPIFLYVVLALAIITALCIIFRKGRSVIKSLLWPVVINAIIIIAYSACVYSVSGYFSMSVVSMMNRMYMVSEADLIGKGDKTYLSDQNKHYIDSISRLYAGTKPDRTIKEEFWSDHMEMIDLGNDIGQINSYVNSCIKSEPKAYADYIVISMKRGLVEPMVCAGHDYGLSINEHLAFARDLGWWMARHGITQGFALVITIVCVVVLLFTWRRQPNALTLAFISLLVLGNMSTTILGAPYDHARLNLPSVIPVLLLVASILSSLTAKRLIRRA